MKDALSLFGNGELLPAADKPSLFAPYTGTVIHLTLPYPPSANQLWRTVPMGSAKGRVGNVLSAEYKAFKKAVAGEVKFAGIVPFVGVPLSVTIRIYRPRKSGDLDGRIKGLLDSLNELAWADDSHIVEIHAFRFDDKANPRAEITIAAMDGGPGL